VLYAGSWHINDDDGNVPTKVSCHSPDVDANDNIALLSSLHPGDEVQWFLYHLLVPTSRTMSTADGPCSFAFCSTSQRQLLFQLPFLTAFHGYHCLNAKKLTNTPKRIDFKLAAFIYRRLHGLAPRGIFPTTSSASPIPIAAVSGRRHPRS